jgi:hypothetical protein
MKIKNSLIGFGLLSLWYVNTALNPSNTPLGVTGAPGEKTCSTQGGCHSGGSFTGTATIDGLPDVVEAGKTYNLTVTGTSATAKNGGFQLTCLDASNAKSGTLIAGANNQVPGLSGGRQYARQIKAATYTGTKISFPLSWTAPATSSGDITFYASVLCANAAGSPAGDNALSATRKVTFKTTATNDAALEKAMTLFPNPVVNELNVTLTDASNATFTLSNQIGQVLITSKVNEKESFDVSNLARGTYFAKIQVGEKQAVKKVVLQ